MFDSFLRECRYVCSGYGHAFAWLICRLEPSKPMPLKKDNSHPEGIKKLGQSLHRDCPIRAHHWQKHSRPIACVLPGTRASQNGLAGTVDSARCAKERWATSNSENKKTVSEDTALNNMPSADIPCCTLPKPGEVFLCVIHRQVFWLKRLTRFSSSRDALPNDHKNHSANTATALRRIFTRFPFHPPFGGHLCTLIFTCYFYYGTPGAICQQNTKIGSAFLGVEILQSAFKMLIFSDARISS